VGILKTADALRYAQERDLDLVEVAPDSKPPVCRVLDYSKYKYEQAQRQKAARKHQQQITIREIKFRPKIAQHDYDTKKGHVERFLKARDKVKVTIMFRGREVAHPERGEIILNRLAEELAEIGVVEQRPTQDGRNMTMMLGPTRTADGAPNEAAARPARRSARPAPAPATAEPAAPPPAPAPTLAPAARAAERRPAEQAKESTREVPAPKAAEGPVESAQPAGRAAKLAAARAARAKEAEAKEEEKKPKAPAKKKAPAKPKAPAPAKAP